jgi:hypothetical protein
MDSSHTKWASHMLELDMDMDMAHSLVVCKVLATHPTFNRAVVTDSHTKINPSSTMLEATTATAIKEEVTIIVRPVDIEEETITTITNIRILNTTPKDTVVSHTTWGTTTIPISMVTL